MDDKQFEDLNQRFDKIEEMLRHIHVHVENLEEYGFVNRESLHHILGILGDNIQELLDKKITGEELAEMVYNLQSSCHEFSEDNYTPIDQKDKEEHEKIMYEREKSRKEKLDKEVALHCL